MSEAGTLSSLLRAIRLERDLTLEALAEKAGVSDRTISDIERGVSTGPRRATMLALADALGLRDAARDNLLAAARAGRRLATSGDDPLMPHRLSDFSGREAEVERLLDMLSSDSSPAVSPVVVSGIPGAGKTSIAVEAAFRLPSPAGPRLFVDLGGIDESPLTPLRVLQSLLQQATGGSDDSRSLADAGQAWVSATAETAVVVILDDAATEAQVRPVLAMDRRSRLVVTSRRALAGLEGAQHLGVGTLERKESVALLARIIPPAQAATGDLDELARLCGDLPLALRVAANRIASHSSRSVEDFTRRLRAENRRLAALVAGDLAVEATFAASYNQLPTATREMFRCLALLRASSFSAPMAGAILDISGVRAEDLLEDLVDLGLLEVLQGERYRLHDLLRLYAGERLRAELEPDQVAALETHLGRWVLGSATNAGLVFAPPEKRGANSHPGATFSGMDDAKAWLITEVDYWFTEYRRAADEGRFAEVVETTNGVSWFGDRWLTWGHWHELFAIAAHAAEATGDRFVEVESLNNHAYMLLWEVFQPDLALEVAREAVEIAERYDDRVQLAWALGLLSTSLFELGRVEESIPIGERAGAIFAETGDTEGELSLRNQMAVTLIETDPAAALERFQQIVEITEDPHANLSDNHRYSDRLGAKSQIAKCLLKLGRYEEAIEMGSAVIALGQSTVDADRARGHRHRGLGYLGLGDVVRARADLEKALELTGGVHPKAWGDEIRAALDSLDAADRGAAD